MTSFATAFGSSDYEDNYDEINSNKQQEINQFSNIDLGLGQQQASYEQFSSYRSVNDAATFRTDSSSTAGAILNSPSHSSSQIKFYSILLIYLSFFR